MAGTEPGRTGLFRRQPIAIADSPDALQRVLGLSALTAIGLGAIVGVGIFVLTGIVAATMAGPAVILSFLLAGAVSACSALAYAEFAGRVPRAGSAYAYAYASLGELPAWIIGWDLLLEYALIVAVVAIGWSGYVRSLLGQAGIGWPAALGAVRPGHVGQSVDVLAGLAALGTAALLTVRIDLGGRVNTAIVAAKIAAVLAVIAIGAPHVHPANWTPFLPFGWGGVVGGASVVFFAVFGYDALTAAAEEARAPVRDVPRAVLLSLAVAMVLYLAMCLVLTGIVPYRALDDTAPVAHAFRLIGLGGAAALVSAGAIAGMTSVLFACLLACTRIWWAMARDGLLPAWFAVTHPRWGTPHRPTAIAGVVTAVAASLFPIRSIAELVNVGSLSAFALINVAVLVTRRRLGRPEGSFAAPALPIVATLGAAGSLFLIWGLPAVTMWRFVGWLAVGLVLYAVHGRTRSRLAGPRLR